MAAQTVHTCIALTCVAVLDALLEVALLKVHRGAVGQEGHVLVVQLNGPASRIRDGTY